MGRAQILAMEDFARIADDLMGASASELRAALEAAYRAGLEAVASQFDQRAAEAERWIAAARTNTEMQLHTATRLRAEHQARKIRALGV